MRIEENSKVNGPTAPNNDFDDLNDVAGIGSIMAGGKVEKVMTGAYGK